jgi:Cu/Ag efflux pump CusA
MIPLLSDPFFSAMAVTIMFGLGFACVLTMIVVPVLFVILFRIKAEPESARTPTPKPGAAKPA